MSAVVVLILFIVVATVLIFDKKRDLREKREYEVWKKQIQGSMESYNKEMDEIFKNIDQLIKEAKEKLNEKT